MKMFPSKNDCIKLKSVFKLRFPQGFLVELQCLQGKWPETLAGTATLAGRLPALRE